MPSVPSRVPVPCHRVPRHVARHDTCPPATSTPVTEVFRLQEYVGTTSAKHDPAGTTTKKLCSYAPQAYPRTHLVPYGLYGLRSYPWWLEAAGGPGGEEPAGGGVGPGLGDSLSPAAGGYRTAAILWSETRMQWRVEHNGDRAELGGLSLQVCQAQPSCGLCLGALTRLRRVPIKHRAKIQFTALEVCANCSFRIDQEVSECNICRGVQSRGRCRRCE